MYNRFFIRTDDYVLIGDNQGNERTMYDLRQDPHEFFDIEKKNSRLSEELYQHVLELAGGPLPVLRVGDRGDARHDQYGARQLRAASPARGGRRRRGGWRSRCWSPSPRPPGAAGASSSAASTSR